MPLSKHPEPDLSLQLCLLWQPVESSNPDHPLCTIWRKPQAHASAQSSLAARLRVWLFAPRSPTAPPVFVPFLQLPAVPQPEAPLLAPFCVRSPPHAVAARPAVSPS